MKNTSNNHNIYNKDNLDEIIIKKRKEGKCTKKIKHDSPTLDSFIEDSGVITDNEYEVKSEIDYNEKSE